jgi:hypothetical protein
MAIVINGSGTVTGLAVGGLPDGTVDAGTLATNSVDSAELVDGAVDDSHMASISGRKNMIINGAMQIAQRGTSSGASVYQTVDRFWVDNSGNDELPTQAQHALTSSDTEVWAKGFRYSYHMTNGNQTDAGGADRVVFKHYIEAQDMATSGWDYTSSSSYITLSFWCKSSVAQNFYGRLETFDGTGQGYVFETGSLTADTWTKITKTIPGNSNLTFDNNSSSGFLIEIAMFRGTDKTGTRPLNAWHTFAGDTRLPDMTSTWYTTNDATFEFTGVQLELGSTATDFEHRSYGEELALCQRYYFKSDLIYFTGFSDGNTSTRCSVNGQHPVTMRTDPTVTYSTQSLSGSPLTGAAKTGGFYYVFNGNANRGGISDLNSYVADAEL